MALNKALHKAKAAKRDEFYTQLSDIENELRHYRGYFHVKSVYCNCDDPKVSNFFHYFSYNFRQLGLKELIATCYKSCDADLVCRHESTRAICLRYGGTGNENNIPSDDEIIRYPLKGDGDFRSDECIALLHAAEIVVTNPPFSLFREYVAQLFHYDKKFLIIGHQNAISYKEIFSLTKNKEIWLGVNNGGTKWFQVNPDPLTTGDAGQLHVRLAQAIRQLLTGEIPG